MTQYGLPPLGVRAREQSSPTPEDDDRSSRPVASNPDSEHEGSHRSRRAVVITLGPERSEPERILEQEVFNDVVSDLITRMIPTRGFNRFALYLFIDSTGAPTDIQIFPVFLSKQDGRNHELQQGVFASLVFDDVVTAAGLATVFTGDIAGDFMGIRVFTNGTTASLLFTVDAELVLIRDI